MQRKISKIAVKMTAVLMAVVVCLPMVMSVMKQNVYAAGESTVIITATFDYNNGKGKTKAVSRWASSSEVPTVEADDYPTELSVFDGWYLVDSSGNMTTTEVTDGYKPDFGKDFTAKAKWSESAYEITIPATTSINATDKTGSVDFSGKLGKNKEMSIAVSSANGNKMVNGSYGVDYTMDKNSFSYDSDDAIKTFSDSINFEVTSEPAVAGSYKDTLTFTITAEAKAIEVTIDHNDGTGTTSTAKLAIGEAVLASLPAITRDGYKFLGWTYVDASGNEVEVTDGLIYDGTITGFKANWVNMNPVLQKGSDFNKNIANTTTAIEFTTEAIPSSVTDYTDVSEAQDGSILAYMDGTTMKVSPKVKGATIYANSVCSNMFEPKTNLASIEFNNFDTSKVTDMRYMFYGCSSLTTLDVSNFDTSNVVDMDGMFKNCSSLVSLDLSKFNTSKAFSMGSMFSYCSSLTTLDVSSFDTSNVTGMVGMFEECSSLTTLDVSNFDTSKVTDMRYMFYGCSNLTSLDLSSFDTTNVTLYSGVFSYCPSLSQITVGDKWVQPIAFPNKGVSSAGKWYALSSGTEYAYNAIPTGAADVYTVTKTTGIVFDANGGTFEDGSTINYVINGDTSTYKIAVASDTGKVFKGWATTKDATSAEYKADGSDLPTDYNGKLYAVMTEPTTITFNADGGTFDDGSTVNTIVYDEAVTKYSHTDNISDDGTQNGNYGNNEKKTEVVTIEGATSLTVTVTYGGQNAWYDWVSIFSGSHPTYTAASDYSKADIVQRLGGGSHINQTKTYTVSGDSVTFAWKSDSSGYGDGYGYYAVVTSTTIISGSYKEPVPTDSNRRFRGWTTTEGSTTVEYKADGSDIPKDKSLTLYAVITDISWAEDNWTYELTTDGYIWLRAYNGSETNYVIPSTATIDGKTYKTKIGNWGNNYFAQLKTGTITSLSFEKGVTLHNNLYELFHGCSNLISLDLSNLDTSGVTNMGYMFSGCSKLTSLNISSFNTSNVTNMCMMFDNCSNLKSLDLSNFNTSAVINMANMFEYCSNLTSINVASFDTSSATNMSYMFYCCSSLATLNVSNFNTNAVTKMSSMFAQCSNLTLLDLSNFDTSNVTSMDGMFARCSNLTSLNISGFNTSKVTNTGTMFEKCTSLVSIDVSSFDTSTVTVMASMFYDCTNLKSIYVSNSFTTNKVTSSTNMFYDSPSLVGGNGTKYSSSYIDKTYARIDTASTPGYFTLKSSANTASLSDGAEDDVSILSVASLAKTYSSADFALDGDSAIETANLDDEASEEAVAYYHLNDDEDLNGLLAMSVESISIDGVMMDENAEYDDTKFVIEQSEDGVLTITSIVGEGYPSLDDWKALIYGNIFTDINEDVTITVSVVGLDENADINGFALVEEQTSSDLKEEQTSSDVEGEEALDQEEGASESAEGASVVSWQAETDQTSPEQTSPDLVDEVEATATPETTGAPSASAE